MKVSPPILRDKQYPEPSVFTADNLLREARRQKSLDMARVPPVCMLDPDGDIVRWLIHSRGLVPDPSWACYHTDLYTFVEGDTRYGIIGCAVGAPFAVLVAEELFACGCELLVSVTSAGQIGPAAEPPYFVLIEKALRDEGTSYHYLPPSDFSHISPRLLPILDAAFREAPFTIHRGSTWTTDAPFRETESAISACREQGILGVEMEAAALYALADAKGWPIVCLAHVTNRMATSGEDFEKGADGGSREALQVASLVAGAWTRHHVR